MKISLIHTPYKHKIFSENIKFVNEEFCKAPPLILAYVAAIIKKAGHKVQLIDAHNLDYNKETILAKVKEFSPDLLAFRSETYNFHHTLRLGKYLKENINGIKILVGGINIDWYPTESFHHGIFDYGLIGEAIHRLPQLLNKIEQNKNILTIEGTILYEDKTTSISPLINTTLSDFNLYPYPARQLLPNSIYHSIISKKKNFTIMLTSTGCPYQCSFCAVKSFPYRERTAANILPEIKECYYDYNIKEIDFFDSVFFANKKRSFDLFNNLINLNLDLEWSCRSRVDMVDEKILTPAKKAGCRQIYFGIESAKSHVLKKIKKNISNKKTISTLKTCRQLGIKSMGFFIIGNPDETVSDMKETLAYATNLDLNYAQFTKCIAKPFTEYDLERIKITGQDYWRDYVKGNLNETNFPTTWCAVSQAEIAKTTKKAYLKFYLRPTIILTMLRDLASLSELFRYVRVARKLLLNCL